MTDILAYAESGKELRVMASLAENYIPHWRGIRIEFERRGKNRTASPFEYPALPNYIWITTNDLYSLSKIKHLSRTVKFMSRASQQAFAAFAAQVDARATEARRIDGNRSAMMEYNRGEAITIKDSILSDQLARFSAIIQRPHDPHPMIVAEVEMFGRIALIHADPLNVRRALP